MKESNIKPWLVYKEQYTIMMTGQHTDIGLYDPVDRPNNGLEDALDYISNQGNHAYLPGKTIATTYIWAVLAASLYGGDVRELLNDRTLVNHTDDPVYYDDAPDVYDKLIDTLGTDPSFIANGWSPYTAFYFWAECTPEGSSTLEEHYLNDTLDQFIPENYIEKLTHLWK